MICLSGLIGFLLVLTAEARVGNSSEVDFCKETEECLLFDLICQTDKYEVRHYDSTKWVSTSVSTYAMEIAAPMLFTRLFKYITGENKDAKKIEMTAPVVIKLPDKKFWETGVFTMSFVLPSEYQTNPPTPTNSDVYIHDTPQMKVYVLNFGGWLSSLTNSKKINELFAVLNSKKAKYKRGSECVVGYNSPMTMFDRHNEVWVVVEGDPVCPGS